MTIDYGGGLIFPDSWASGPPDRPEPNCTLCEDRGYVVEGVAPSPVEGYEMGSYEPEPCPECSPEEA